VQLVFILEQVLNGLLVGAYYLLIALGLSLIFALGGIVNLAHGGFYAIGAYLTVMLAPRVGFAGAFVISPIVVGLIGIAIERLLFRRFYRSDPILSLLLTFGLAMVIEQGLRIVFGALRRSRSRCFPLRSTSPACRCARPSMWSYSPLPAWGSTCCSVIPGWCRSAMAHGSASARMPPR